MAATWSDLPPELVDLVARALLRLCYTDVHRSRTTPRGELEGHGAWKRKSVPASSVGVLDAGLVDAPTWAAAAPAAAACRQLRRALLAAVGGLALRVPSLETDEDHDDRFGFWNYDYAGEMIAQMRLELEQSQAQAHASGTPAGSV
ncbi:hypothetical protein I4F81_004961 [Pyropia yezoensis]|uniref:Uncharacterized protein n=1 Tax=Pyropia yezoensis TaxID=2788 RepID=A0ACC3BWY0_PYRYE|nr:hypothetical protein I4F81_004961 [Neopyropia yezoensis]